MSDTTYHDSVTVETEVKPNDDLYYLNISCFQFFGLSEKGIQTDLTLKDIQKIDYENKQLKDNNNIIKQDPLMAPIDYNETNNKKNISNKLMNSNKSDNYENKNTEMKGKDIFDNTKTNLSKILKKAKKEEKNDDRLDKDNFLDKKRKRNDEEKQSPSKNKNKLKDVNKLKDKEKIKHKMKSLKEKNSIKKSKDEKQEKSKDKKEKEKEKEKSSKKTDSEECDIKQDISDIKNILGKIIDDSVVKSNSKNSVPKVDAYSLFKKEYMQLKDCKENSENTCQSAWNKISKEMKKFYNSNAIEENKMIRKYFNKLKSYRKNKDNDNNEKNNINETSNKKEKEKNDEDKNK